MTRVTGPEIVSGRAFLTAEHAWFWAVRMSRHVWDGGRYLGGDGEGRPCWPVDVLREASRLLVDQRVTVRHLVVAVRYGVLQRPPDPRVSDEAAERVLWLEFLDRLHTRLTRCGIVGVDERCGG